MVIVAGKLLTGNILHWVSWWDQYKTCIHENQMLTDRDRFNYLRMYVKGPTKKRSEAKDNPEDYLYSATTLPSSSKAKEEERAKLDGNCIHCGNDHEIQDCPLFRKGSVDERLQLLKEMELCFNCLLPRHYSNSCTRPGCSADGCKKKHHALLHRRFPSAQDKMKSNENDQKKEETSDPIVSHNGTSTTTNCQVVLLPSALVNLVSNGTTIPVRILVDSGSDQSYIRKDIADSLNLQVNGPSRTMTIFMHGGQSRTTSVKNVSFQLSRKDGRQRVNLDVVDRNNRLFFFGTCCH